MANIPQFTQESPGWGAKGAEPPEEFKASGYVAGYKPPAGFFNWFWTRVSACISELQSKLAPYMQENEDEKEQLTKQLYVRTTGMESTVTGTVQDIALPDGMDIEDIRGIPIRVGGAGDGMSTAPAVSSASLRVNGAFSAPLYLPKPGARIETETAPGDDPLSYVIFTEGYTEELPEGWSDFGYTATLTRLPEWEGGSTEPVGYVDAFVLERVPRAEMDTGWVEMTLINGFTASVAPGNTPRYRRIGKTVYVMGELVVPDSNTVGSLDFMVFAKLPEGFRPTGRVLETCQGSGIYIWTVSMAPNGEISAGRYRSGNAYVTPVASSWLPFSFEYLVD